jgi:hypothetical protein
MDSGGLLQFADKRHFQKQWGARWRPIFSEGVDNQAKRKSSTVRLAFMTPASAMLEPSA